MSRRCCKRRIKYTWSGSFWGHADYRHVDLIALLETQLADSTKGGMAPEMAWRERPLRSERRSKIALLQS